MHEELEKIVFTSLGRVSVCWEHFENAGVFLSDRAKIIGEKLVQDIEDLYERQKDKRPKNNQEYD